MTNAEVWFNNALRPQKPEGSLGRTADPGRPPRLSHSSWTISAWTLLSCCLFTRLLLLLTDVTGGWGFPDTSDPRTHSTGTDHSCSRRKSQPESEAPVRTPVHKNDGGDLYLCISLSFFKSTPKKANCGVTFCRFYKRRTDMLGCLFTGCRIYSRCTLRRRSCSAK